MAEALTESGVRLLELQHDHEQLLAMRNGFHTQLSHLWDEVQHYLDRAKNVEEDAGLALEFFKDFIIVFEEYKQDIYEEKPSATGHM